MINPKRREELRADFIDKYVFEGLDENSNLIADYWLSILDSEPETYRREVQSNVMKLAVESWHEAQTLKMHVNGQATPDVNLEKMGKILLNKLESFTNPITR